MDATAPQIPQHEPLQVLVLCGLVGSGKTTLAQAMQSKLQNWARVNQDDLGTRQACEAQLHSFLSRGMNVVLDRQNFDVAQRRGWLEIASKYPGVIVSCAVMGTTKDECRSRLLVRQNHPTIDNPQLAVELLDKFESLWVQPSIEEGFDHQLTLPSLPPAQDLTSDLLLALLASIAASPLNPNAVAQRQPRPRGGYNAPSRGGWTAGAGAGAGAPRPPPPQGNRFPPAPAGGAWGGAGAQGGGSWRSARGAPQGAGGGGGGHAWGGGGRTLGGGAPPSA